MSFRKNSIADVLGSPSYASVAHLFYGNLAEKQVIDQEIESIFNFSISQQIVID